MPTMFHESTEPTAAGHRHVSNNSHPHASEKIDLVFAGPLYEACSVSENARGRESRASSRRSWALASFLVALAALTCLVYIVSPHHILLSAAKLRVEQLKSERFANLADDPQLNSQNPNWGYDGKIGPTEWGELSTAWGICSTGSMQSPINIDRKKVMEFDEERLHWKGFEKGTETGSQTAKEFYDGKSIALGDLTGPVIEVMGFSRYLKDLPASAVHRHNYTLKELRIHTPSEHYIDGQSFAAEIQLLHECNPKTTPPCPHAKTMIISVLMSKANKLLGEDSPWFVAMLVDDMKLLGGVWDQYVSLYSFDFGRVASELKSRLSRFFFFKGSLTSPPCTEDVTWFVLKDPVPIADDDLAYLQSVQGKNNRPIQEANDRVIFSI